MLHLLANRKFFHVLHSREGLNKKLFYAVHNVLSARSKHVDVSQKFIWMKMGLAVASCAQHKSALAYFTFRRM